MSEGATFCAVIMMIVFFCAPMLKMLGDVYNDMAKIQRQLENIEKALYVMPDKGDAE